LVVPPIAEEVNIVDLLGVELIRVYHPEVYSQLISSKSALLAINEPSRGRSKDELERWFAELLKLANERLRGPLESLLVRLFPQLRRIKGGGSFATSFYTKWRSERAVNSPDFFDKYFLLGVPPGEVSEIELRLFKAGLEDRNQTLESLLRFDSEGRARRLLEAFYDHLPSLSSKDAEVLIDVLMDVANRVDFSGSGLFCTDSLGAVAEVIGSALRQLPSEDARVKIIAQAIDAGRCRGLVARLLVRIERSSSDGAGGISDASMSLLRKAFVEELARSSASGALWTEADLPSICYRWRDWQSIDAVKAAVSEHAESEEGLLQLINGFRSVGFSQTSDNVFFVREEGISRQYLADFIDLGAVTSRLQEIASGESPHSQKAGEVLKRLLPDQDDR
jgi:predicted KAP-like P-loop ATPase